jgi:hypothetical protein
MAEDELVREGLQDIEQAVVAIARSTVHLKTLALSIQGPQFERMMLEAQAELVDATELMQHAHGHLIEALPKPPEEAPPNRAQRRAAARKSPKTKTAPPARKPTARKRALESVPG